MLTLIGVFIVGFGLAWIWHTITSFEYRNKGKGFLISIIAIVIGSIITAISL